MTISELIERLEEELQLHADIETKAASLEFRTKKSASEHRKAKADA